MRSFHPLAAAVVLALEATALGGAPVGYIGDFEPANNTAAGAAQMLFPNIGGNNCTRAIAGMLSLTIGDDDWFRVSLEQGERLCVMTTPIRSLPSDFFRPDTVVEIRDPALNVVISNDDAGAGVTTVPVGNFGSVVRYIAPVAGNYYLHVNGLGKDEAGPYQLSVIRQVPACITWSGTVNNSPGDADLLGLRQCNPLAAYCLLVANDDDYFGVDLAAGDVISAMTIPSGNPGNFSLPDTNIDVVDTNGVTILGSNAQDFAGNSPASTAGATVRFRAPSDGRYFLHLTSPTTTVSDYTIFTSLIPASQCEGDADGNGIVNFADITAVLTNWNFICN